jgi:chromosomal replication initiation ATPase DnaA
MLTRTMSRADALAICHVWAAGNEPRIVVLHGPSRGGKTKLVTEAVQRMTERSGIPPRVWTAATLRERHVQALLRATMLELPQRCVAPAGALVLEHLEDLGDRPHMFQVIVRTVLALHGTGHPVLMTVTRMPPASTRVLRSLRCMKERGAEVLMVPVP